MGIRDFVPRFSERFFQRMTRSLYGIQDPLCGMKGYKIWLYKARGWFDSDHSIGTELMLYAVRHNAKMAQFPVSTRPRVGQARFGSILRINYGIMRAAIFGMLRR